LQPSGDTQNKGNRTLRVISDILGVWYARLSLGAWVDDGVAGVAADVYGLSGDGGLVAFSCAVGILTRL
jgi:hypothetical protein